jgi:hypothetical protein
MKQPKLNFNKFTANTEKYRPPSPERETVPTAHCIILFIRGYKFIRVYFLSYELLIHNYHGPWSSVYSFLSACFNVDYFNVLHVPVKFSLDFSISLTVDFLYPECPQR